MAFRNDSLKFENKSNPQSSEPRPSLHSLHLDASRLVANELAVFTQTIVSKGDLQMINGLKNICDEVEIYHNILRWDGVKLDLLMHANYRDRVSLKDTCTFSGHLFVSVFTFVKKLYKVDII